MAGVFSPGTASAWPLWPLCRNPPQTWICVSVIVWRVTYSWHPQSSVLDLSHWGGAEGYGCVIWTDWAIKIMFKYMSKALHEELNEWMDLFCFRNCQVWMEVSMHPRCRNRRESHSRHSGGGRSAFFSNLSVKEATEQVNMWFREQSARKSGGISSALFLTISLVHHVVNSRDAAWRHSWHFWNFVGKTKGAGRRRKQETARMFSRMRPLESRWCLVTGILNASGSDYSPASEAFLLSRS